MGKPTPEIPAQALDEPCMRGVLGSVARARFGSGTEVSTLRAECRRRQILLYSTWLTTAGSPERMPWRVIAKVYASAEAGQRAYEAMRRLWDEGFAERAPSTVRIPEPYAYLPELRLLFMEEARGARLKKLVREGLAGVEHMHALARAMVKLHRTPSIFTRPFTIEDHLAVRCAGLSDGLAAEYPALADAIRWIVAAARESEQQMGHDSFTLVHGDLHLGQVQIEGSETWILDLDPLHLGDPAYDVAMIFVALKQLEGTAIRASDAHALRDAFVSAYFSHMGWELAARVSLHEGLIHLKRACNRLRWKNESGWAERIPSQIRQSMACIEAWRSLRAPRSLVELTEIYARCPGAV
jgi:aminoglycoside phosphotransferase (APT) family kinase protein